MGRRRLGDTDGTNGRRNSRSGAVGAHPGKTDRMIGNKSDGATGPSHPDYLPTKRGRRRY